MRQDPGVDGDISANCADVFLKIIDDQDQEMELLAVTTASYTRKLVTA